MADVSAHMSVSHHWPRYPPDWAFWVCVMETQEFGGGHFLKRGVCGAVEGVRLRRERMEMRPIHPSTRNPPDWHMAWHCPWPPSQK